MIHGKFLKFGKVRSIAASFAASGEHGGKMEWHLGRLDQRCSKARGKNAHPPLAYL